MDSQRRSGPEDSESGDPAAAEPDTILYPPHYTADQPPWFMNDATWRWYHWVMYYLVNLASITGMFSEIHLLTGAPPRQWPDDLPEMFFYATTNTAVAFICSRWRRRRKLGQ